MARTHGLYDAKPVIAHELSFTPTVDAALSGYLERLPPVGETPAATVFTALAYAPAYGLPTAVWSVVLESLAAKVSQGGLAQFAGTSAANFLVESSGEGYVRRYRLFHQALNDALLRRQETRGGRNDGERLITRALIDYGRRHNWSNVDSYLYQALPIHADRVGMIDELLNDNDYLLHADLRRLTPLADRAVTPQGQARCGFGR